MPGLFAASFSHLFAYHEFSASRFFDTTADSIVLDYTNKPATSVMVPLFSWCSVFNVYIMRFLLYSIIRSFVKFFSPRATIYFLYSLLLATFSFLAMLLKLFFYTLCILLFIIRVITKMIYLYIIWVLPTIFVLVPTRFFI